MIESVGIFIILYVVIEHKFLLLVQPGEKRSLDRVSKQSEVDMNIGRGEENMTKMRWGRYRYVPCLKSYSEAALTYLSLVIMYVEEVCVPGQVYHRSDIVLGLVDDGQVEQPIDRER